MKKLIRTKARFIISVLILGLLVAVPVFASSAEGEHGSPVLEWLWKVVNFAILVFVLVKFGGKPIKSFLAKRTELLEKRLSEAREAKELAEKALVEVNERLKNKDKEIAEIISAAKLSGEKERDALIKEGQRLSEKAVEQARSNIEYELKRAREELKAEAANLALELAEKKLKERITPDVQKKLLEESLAKLESGK